MQITSTAFQDGERIPRQHTGEGPDTSPPLEVEDVPDDAATLALIVDDPDAPGKTWVHWLIWNVPASHTAFPGGVPQVETVAELGDAAQGLNDFDEIGWGGPMPPPGHGTHHYRFTVHALGREIDVDPGADRETLDAALEEHTLATARLTGTYERE